VAVALDEPGTAVALDEPSHGVAKLVDGGVQLDPQALVFEGADPALGAAVGLRLARNAGSSAMPSQASKPVKWGRAVLGSPVVPQLEAPGDVGV
jgi:hypothetical protein